MGKKEKRPQFPNGFVALEWDLLLSEAYRALSPTSAKMLPFFLGKVKSNLAHFEAYKVNFSFPYSEIKKLLGYSYSTISKCICELVEKGFLEPVRKGGLRAGEKVMNKFTLSRRWNHYGKMGFIKKNWKTFCHADE